ncbi:MAG: methyltransferase domain-containing protein [Gammaproteobacteria bacterium]|nr:methyltransferase domain-containing protein [Gammaproteobacteria bacterium]
MHRTDSIKRWFSQYPGSLLLDQERACLEEVGHRCFGYYLLQVGSIGGEVSGLVPGRLRSQIIVAPEQPGTDTDCWIRGNPDQLPIASDSVDVALLLHTLDFYPDPHQTLREVDRVLIPEGKLVIFGFNPWSLWGLRRLFTDRTSHSPWNGRFISIYRIYDWLSLLGFRVEATWPLMFRPPLRQRVLMQRLDLLERSGKRWWPALSGVYMVEAVKRVSTLTPIKPQWKLRNSILGGGAIEPSANVAPWGRSGSRHG